MLHIGNRLKHPETSAAVCLEKLTTLNLGPLMQSNVWKMLLKVLIFSKFIHKLLQPWQNLAYLRTTLVSIFGFSLLQFFYSIFSPVKTDTFSLNKFISQLFVAFSNNISLHITIRNIILSVSFHLLVKTKSISAETSIIFIFEPCPKWSTSI